MEPTVKLENIYKPSGDIVVRDIEGEIIIVPLVAGIGNLDDELFSLNTTGRAIWDKMDGKKTVADIARELLIQFEATQAEMEADVLGFIAEVYKRKMAIEA